jgi:hypothetical protein
MVMSVPVLRICGPRKRRSTEQEADYKDHSHE